MGNHDAGRAMVRTAEALAKVREKTGQTAMEILDEACSNYAGCDAEFDDSAVPGEVFGNLITEAFCPRKMTPESVAAEVARMNEGGVGEGFDWWYEEVYMGFRTRYQLC